jgi:flavin reductase (DIM6/NTAB) family NADH-FMN oxidoreductase RutF
MMTASWGFMGEMWGQDTTIAMIRPQRYTMEFVDKNDYYALSFYGNNKEIHKVCGSMSGRDVDKTALTGLTPVFADNTVYFEEANLVIICKKQYVQDMDETCFIDKEPLKWYANKDYHKMIFGKIEKVLVKE